MTALLKQLARATFRVLRTTQFAGSRNQRAVAEAIADAVADHWETICSGLVQDPRSDCGPRHMADVSIALDPQECWIDIKTRNLDKGFNMPNLTAVRRLDDFYRTPTHSFLILLVEYRLDGQKTVVIEGVDLFPIEILDWNCLQVAALGRGQLQIRDAKRIVLDRKQSRQQWLAHFYEHLVAFYRKEMQKDQRDLDWATRRLAVFHGAEES